MTDGAVDPTVGLDLARLGYDRDILLVTDTAGTATGPPAARSSWRDVRLDREAGLLTVPSGTALDLGSAAKA